MQKKIFIANWKMNPQSGKEAEKILAGYFKGLRDKKVKSDIVICPPFVWLGSVFKKIKNQKNIFLGAQNVFWESNGAYTGEVSPQMIKDVGCRYVIIGHSERRKYANETDEMINKKILSALKSGFNAVLCVGEHHRENKNEIPQIVEDQVRLALNNVPKAHFGKIIIAYEPVWAIGTGTPDTPEGAMMAAMLIRKIAVDIFGNAAKSLPVLYGGSVNAENAASFVNHEGIDGVLVGGASLNPEEFSKIILSA